METKEDKEKGLIFVRLFPNEDFYGSLKSACEKHDVKTAVIVSGLGQLKNFSLGYFKEKGDYLPEEFSEPYELISLTGNISKQENGDYEFHVHSSLGDSSKKVIGGHLIKGVVEITNEIVLLKSNINVHRKVEEQTGLKGLFLE